jgi:hypothetical protein
MKQLITLLAVLFSAITFAQNVGIGTTSPADKLTVQTGVNGYGVTHTNGTVTVGTYITGAGGWYGTKTAHPLYFFTNNSAPLVTLSTLGNFGIGTITPGAKLEVNGQIKINGGTPGAGNLLESDATGLATWVDKSASFLPTGASGNTLRHTGAGWVANSLLYNNGTNIGIGTVIPNSKLEVFSSGFGISQNDGTVSVGTYTSPTGGWIGTRTNHALHFFSNNSAERMTLSAAGNFGIGTTNPTYILDINGRPRLRHNGATAGMWYNKADNTEAAFVGMFNDSTLGFYGTNGWTSGFDVKNGQLGIGTLDPTAPLSFPNALGNKINLFGDAATPHYGIGIQGSLMQFYTGGSGADIAFGYGKSSNFVETMRIKGNGNVGIGGTTSSYRLHVLGWPNDKLLQLENTDLLDNGTYNTIMFQTGGQYTAAIKTIGQTTSTADLGFYTGTSGVETGLTRRMTIANNGNVGIGVFAPLYKLHIISPNNAANAFYVSSTDLAGSTNASGEIASDFGSYYTGGEFRANATSTKNAQGVFGYAFSSQAGSAYGVYGTAFRLGGTGATYAGYFQGTLAYTGSLFNASDATLKTNIKPFENALSSINKLKIKQYEFTSDSKKIMNTAEGEHIGVLAQELQQVFPTLVSKQVQPIYENIKDEKGNDKRTQTGTKEYLGVNYMELIPVLIKGMQEQQVMIEELKKKIEVLEKK